MSRLPTRPDLVWSEDAVPLARAHDDVYFSRADGLEEARVVFLSGCGLPESWARRRQFTVAELGFGSGLNFLALWQIWRAHRPCLSAQLHFLSFEASPLSADDACKVHGRWPELESLSQKLCAKWPTRARGVQQISWPEEQITLTLHTGDVRDMLPQSRFLADAWFLDGFSPAKNPTMWAAPLYSHMAQRSAQGARLGTYTVAATVRHGLADAGFEVSKAPGFGRKRERLEAIYRGKPSAVCDPFGLRSAAQPPQRVAIIGAGVAGLFAAQKLVQQGVKVKLFERGRGAGGGASGNPLALMMPRLDRGDTIEAQVLIDAYLAARESYADQPGALLCDVVQQPKDSDDRTRFAKLLKDPPLGEKFLSSHNSGGVLHRAAYLIRPAELLKALSEGVECEWNFDKPIDLTARSVGGENFDAIVLANGMGVKGFPETEWLPLKGRLGQVEYLTDLPAQPAAASVNGHYLLTADDVQLTGATFEAASGSLPKVRPDARAANLRQLAVLDPDAATLFRQGALASRAGIRASTPDFLPMVGALPGFALACERFAPLRQGRQPDLDAPLYEGIYLVAGLGSRGFMFAPLLARILLAQLLCGPAPTAQPILAALSPMRFILRGLKRRQF